MKIKMPLLLTALTTVLATGATAQSNPYAACIAQAGPAFGSAMTIENLRQYMAEHPECMSTTPARGTTTKKSDPHMDCINTALMIQGGGSLNPLTTAKRIEEIERTLCRK